MAVTCRWPGGATRWISLSSRDDVGAGNALWLVDPSEVPAKKRVVGRMQRDGRDAHWYAVDGARELQDVASARPLKVASMRASASEGKGRRARSATAVKRETSSKPPRPHPGRDNPAQPGRRGGAGGPTPPIHLECGALPAPLDCPRRGGCRPGCVLTTRLHGGNRRRE